MHVTWRSDTLETAQKLYNLALAQPWCSSDPPTLYNDIAAAASSNCMLLAAAATRSWLDVLATIIVVHIFKDFAFEDERRIPTNLSRQVDARNPRS